MSEFAKKLMEAAQGPEKEAKPLSSGLSPAGITPLLTGNAFLAIRAGKALPKI